MSYDDDSRIRAKNHLHFANFRREWNCLNLLIMIIKKLLTKKTSSFWKKYAPYIAIMATLFIIWVWEYLFSEPSNWIGNLKSSVTRKEVVQVCTKEYTPLCGKNGKTYSNSCMARADKMEIARFGPCESTTLDRASSWETIISDIPSLSRGEAPIVQPVASSWMVYDTGSYQIYTNTSYKYSLALPKSVYYQWNKWVGWASHLFSIGFSGTGVEVFDTAPVRVYFYASGVTPSVTWSEKILEKWTIVVQGDTTDPKIAKIIEIILGSARSF